jgi:5-formyltetrahydrofolate cyclo-ligase
MAANDCRCRAGLAEVLDSGVRLRAIIKAKFNLEMNRILTGEKKELRQRLLNQRQALLGSDRQHAQKCIAKFLADRAAAMGWKSAAVFLPWRGEPDLLKTWQAWHQAGLQLALPTVVLRGAPLTMRPWQPTDPLTQDAMGLQAPLEDQYRPSLDCQVWIIPCVGVGLDGARLGAGMGFYDRTLSTLKKPHPMLIGVCFDFAKGLPAFAEPHDLKLNALVTESGWVEF